MTLIQRINKELTELFNLGQIGNAILPQSKFKVASQAIPGYFAGNFDAETVFVNLNPGDDVKKAEAYAALLLSEMRPQGVSSFIKMHIDDATNAGFRIGNNLDHFDVKTAAFLSEWPNSGILFPNKPVDFNNLVDKMVANTNCLNQKLQLELLPYPSKDFSSVIITADNANILFPFLETILDEIFRKERKYVIFASRKFMTLFNFYNGTGNYTIQLGDENSISLIKSGGNQSRNVTCVPLTICNKNNRIQKAIIACSFPNHAFSKAYDLMRQYGEFCFKCY